MKLSHQCWQDVKAYFKENDTVLLSIGSIESHGKHCPLGTDTLIPEYIIETIDPSTNILILPTLPFGACNALSDFPGTINLGIDLLYQTLKRITDQLYEMGARHFIILNGHGGNIKTIEEIGIELSRKGALLAELNWWLMAWDLNPKWKGGHGGAEETSAILAINPELVHLENSTEPLAFKDVSDQIKATGFVSCSYNGVTINIPRATTQVTNNGWIGDDHPNQSSIKWGEEMLDAVCKYILDFIEVFKNAPLPEKRG